MTLGFSTAARAARMNALATQAGSNAWLRIYSGTRPATGGTATTLLVELQCTTTLAPTTSTATITLNPFSTALILNSGTATWFRIATSASVAVIDGQYGTDLQGSTATFVQGSQTALTSFTLTDGNP
jgi:hypothetical protein